MAKRHMSLDLNSSPAVAPKSCETDHRLPLSDKLEQEPDSVAKRSLQCDTNYAVRRDKRSPTVGCKRPMAIGLPRLNLSLISEHATATQQSSSRLEPTTPSTSSYSCSADDFTPSSVLSSPSTSVGSLCIPGGPNVLADQPTNILPFLFLGSQRDALSEDVINANRIKYVINVSTTSPQSPYVSDTNFLRIPVNDSHTDRLIPFFRDAFQFLDAARESSARVLVHCLAGISRSPTLVIAYIMRHLGMTTDQAYRYVKDRRPSISPNFNFLGQLVEYETQLQASDENKRPAVHEPQSDQVQSAASSSTCPTRTNATSVAKISSLVPAEECPTRSPSPVKRPCFIDVSRSSSAAASPHSVLSTNGFSSSTSVPRLSAVFGAAADVTVVQSPTTAMSKLNFDLHVAAGGTAVTAGCRAAGNRSRHTVRLANISTSSSNSNQTTSNASNSCQQVQSHYVSGLVSAGGSADLIGAALCVTPHENHQVFAWSPSRNQFTVLYGRSDIEPDIGHHRVTDEHDLLWQQVQQASMKSRSFEDILMLSKDTSNGGSGVDLSATSGWTARGRRSTADPDGMDSSRTAAESGVPPSLNSHGGSLHGSLEMIQVS